MRPLRRLDDPTTYFGLSLINWLYVASVFGVLYFLIAVAHAPFRPVVTLTCLVGGALAMLMTQSARQALGPARYLRALLAQRRHRRGLITHEPAPLLKGGVRLRELPPYVEPTFTGWDPNEAADAHLADMETTR